MSRPGVGRTTGRRGERKALDGHEAWLAERFRQHRGKADVVRQDLAREKGIAASLRTVERAVAGWRRAVRAEARATVRFETPPGHQLQIDFGETRVAIGGESLRVYLFVATLGYSRRVYAQPFRHERQSAWMDGIEAAFGHFGGVPQEVLLDNPRALVQRHDAATGEVCFNDKFHAFAHYWDFRPRACAPYRARTKSLPSRKRAKAGARTSAAWATSNTMRSPVTSLSVGRRSRPILSGGCARSPTPMYTALLESHPSSASRAPRPVRCARSRAGRP